VSLGLGRNETDMLCLATKEFLEDRLKTKYPTFDRFILRLQNPRGQHKKPDTRFHVYWLGVASVSFSGSTGSQNEPRKRPTPEAIFRDVGKAFDDGPGFLAHLASVAGIQATEVEASLFHRPTAGGVVKSPNFYLGFECSPAPTQKPTSEEQERLLECVLPRALKEIHMGHDNKDFVGLGDLRIVKTEINEAAGKPFVKFNLYVEFEATGIFKQNTPQPMEFYSSISNIVSSSFMSQLTNNVGGDFSNARRMAINPVAYIENLHEEEGDVDADIVPIHVEFWIALVVNGMNAAPNTNELSSFDRLMESVVDNRLASVYGKTKYQGSKTFEPAEELGYNIGLPLPRFNVLRRYQTDINMRNPVPHPNAILEKIVRCDIGSLLLRVISLDDTSCWCNTREATMGCADVAKQAIKHQTFGGKRGPLPVVAPKATLPKPLGQRIPLLGGTQPDRSSTQIPSPLPSDQLKERSVSPNTAQARQLKERPVSPNPVSPNTPTPGSQNTAPARPPPYGQLKERPVSPNTPNPVSPNTAPATRHMEPQVPEKVAPRPAAIEASTFPFLSGPSLTRSRNEPEAKPSQAGPTSEGYNTKTAEPQPLIFGVCTALTVDRCENEPTKREYGALTEATARYYTSHLKKIYEGTGTGVKNQFEKVDVSLRKTEFGSCKPSKQYNVYIEWDVSMEFSGDGETEPMDACEMRCVLVAKVETMDYLVKYVRSLSGTVFENATGIFMSATQAAMTNHEIAAA